MGVHECELCLRDRREPYRSNLELFVQSKTGGGFEAPAMLLHYVKQHGYRPPDSFIAAVLDAGSVEDLIIDANIASIEVLRLLGERRQAATESGGPRP